MAPNRYFMRLLAGPFLVLALWQGLTAQPIELNFERIKIPGGFYSNRIHAIVQDHHGFIWLGTDGGLLKYDGVRFTRVGPSRISDSQIWDVFVDRSGLVWICTQRGLQRLDPSTHEIVSYRHDPDDPKSLSSDLTRSVIESRDGLLWVGTVGGGLNRFDRHEGTFTSFRHAPGDPTSLTSDDVVTLLEDRNGTIWVGTGVGLSRFHPDSETFTQYLPDPDDESSLIASPVYVVTEDRDGRIWVGTGGDGLHTYNPGRDAFERHRYDPSKPDRLSRPVVGGAFTTFSVSFVHQDRRGMIWIGAHSGGLNVYNPVSGNLQHFEVNLTGQNSLANNIVWSIGESHEGAVWIGTLARGGAGLNRVTRANPIRFTRIDSVSTVRSRSIFETSDGTIWVGTSDAGLYGVDGASAEVEHYRWAIDNPSRLTWNSFAIDESDDGTIWIGGDGTLCQFHTDTGRCRHVKSITGSDDGNPEEFVRAVYAGAEGVIWIGFRDLGLARFNTVSGEVTFFRHDSENPLSLRSNHITDQGIRESSKGFFWIVTDDGLDRFDPGSETFDHILVDLQDGKIIRGFFEAKDGSVWIAWEDGTIGFLDPEHGNLNLIEPEESHLPGREIASMLADDSGRLWVRTDEEIARFDTGQGVFIPYGLGTERFHEGGFGAYKTRDGRLIFGAQNGFHSFYPEELIAAEDHTPPQVQLTGLTVSDEEIEAGDDSPLAAPIGVAEEIRLSHDQREFAIGLAALHYLNPTKNRLLYTLEGYDDGWREAGSDRSATYFRVPPGSYTFRAKAASPYGVWSEQEASISIAILPPWWRSGLAYLAYALALSVLLYLGHMVRVRTLRERASDLENLVEERTKDLRSAKEKTEEQSKRLVELGEVKDRFFYNMSHEFRTPLTLILGPVDDALSGAHGELAPALRQGLQTVQRNGRRLYRLISQLLDLSKLEVGRIVLHPAEHDIVNFVRYNVLAFAPLAERRLIGLTFKSDIESLPAYFDADKLEHVLTNLLSNAFKFTSEHGKILVTVARVEEGRTTLAKISVRDTGNGIPESEIPFIFDRFRQADSHLSRAVDGSGIGLALAKEMVELHHGTIEVESEEEFGTEFIVKLPVGSGDTVVEEVEESDDEKAASGVFSEPTWLSQLQTRDGVVSEDRLRDEQDLPTVLVIDDNDDVREYLRGHLADRYNVIEAADGSDGLVKARDRSPDLILADIMMPGMDGYEMCRMLKGDDKTAHIPIIMLTAMASEEAELEGLAAGADDYISKPFSAGALLARVENLIEIRRFLRLHFTDRVTIESTGVTVESVDAAFLAQVRNAIEDHLDDSNFSVEWLADEVGLSTRHLRRRLRELANLSPGGFIRMIRLQRAAELLEQEAGNVSEIAYRVGFNDPRYFSRLFQQTFGVAPSEYSGARPS